MRRGSTEVEHMDHLDADQWSSSKYHVPCRGIVSQTYQVGDHIVRRSDDDGSSSIGLCAPRRCVGCLREATDQPGLMPRGVYLHESF